MSAYSFVYKNTKIRWLSGVSEKSRI